MFETTACVPANSLTLAPFPDPASNQTVPCGYNQISSFASSNPCHQNQNQNQNQSNSLFNLLQFSQEITNNNMSSNNNEISSKGDPDEYGFLWDMGLEESSLENGVPSNLEEMRSF